MLFGCIVSAFQNFDKRFFVPAGNFYFMPVAHQQHAAFAVTRAGLIVAANAAAAMSATTDPAYNVFFMSMLPEWKRSRATSVPRVHTVYRKREALCQ